MTSTSCSSRVASQVDSTVAAHEAVIHVFFPDATITVDEETSEVIIHTGVKFVGGWVVGVASDG